jgi:hypothetical protein
MIAKVYSVVFAFSLVAIGKFSLFPVSKYNLDFQKQKLLEFYDCCSTFSSFRFQTSPSLGNSFAYYYYVYHHHLAFIQLVIHTGIFVEKGIVADSPSPNGLGFY